MSAGLPPVYLCPQPELYASQVGRDVARDRSGRPVPAPFWADVVHSPPSTGRFSGVSSMYMAPPYVEGGSMAHHVRGGIASPPSVLRPPQRTEVRSASVHLHAQVAADAAVPFPGPISGRLGSNSFRVGPEQRGNPQGFGNADVPGRHVARVPAVGVPLANPNQTWEEMFGTGFAPRAHPLLPPLVRSWEPTEPTCIQPTSLVRKDTSSAEPHNAEDDEVCTILCEWTDEHGTCNMDIFGDRVWMSHHLSRQHNVVGHEKTQRACLWRGCTETMNKGSLARHVVSRHVRAGASCGFCRKVYSRADVARRHTKKCKVANGVVQRDQTKW